MDGQNNGWGYLEAKLTCSNYSREEGLLTSEGGGAWHTVWPGIFYKLIVHENNS